MTGAAVDGGYEVAVWSVQPLCVLSDGALRPVGNPVRGRLTEATPTAAETVASVRAVEAAGWIAFVYGAARVEVEVVGRAARVVVLRAERTEVSGG